MKTHLGREARPLPDHFLVHKENEWFQFAHRHSFRSFGAPEEVPMEHEQQVLSGLVLCSRETLVVTKFCV